MSLCQHQTHKPCWSLVGMTLEVSGPTFWGPRNFRWKWSHKVRATTWIFRSLVLKSTSSLDVLVGSLGPWKVHTFCGPNFFRVIQFQSSLKTTRSLLHGSNAGYHTSTPSPCLRGCFAFLLWCCTAKVLWYNARLRRDKSVTQIATSKQTPRINSLKRGETPNHRIS